MRVPFAYAGSAVALVVLQAAACIGDDPGAEVRDGADGAADASAAADASVDDADAGVDEPRCDRSKPFGDIALVPNVNSDGSESAATLTADELTILFASDRGGQNDIYQATRERVTDGFRAPAPLDDVNAGGRDDQSPTLTADGRTLYLRSNRDGTNGFNDVFVATRDAIAGQFPSFSPAQSVNGATDDINPKIDAANTFLTFASDRPGGGGGGYDLWEAPVVGGIVGSPHALTELNSPAFESHAVLTANALTVYFESGRPDGKGGTDVWTATRPTTSSPFAGLKNVAELNSDADDVPAWISGDECVIYFASARPGLGKRDLYRAARPR